MFDLNKLGGGEWFPWQDSKIGEDGEIEWGEPSLDERICFKQITADRFREIRDKYKGKKVNVPVKNPQTRQMEIVVQYEQTLEQEREERRAFWDETIVDWEIKTPIGEAIPCTTDNKYKLITEEPRFIRFANKCLSVLTQVTEAEAKAAEKTH